MPAAISAIAKRHGAVHHGDAMLRAVILGEAALESLHFLAGESSPVAAAQRAENGLFFLASEDWPGGKRLRTNRRSAEEGKGVAHARFNVRRRGGTSKH
jgi:hypothetical protein